MSDDARLPFTAMVFTLNEEVNLPGCLDSLARCGDVIVVDSFSTDATRAICESRGVRFFQHAFTGFGTQRNWAIDHTSPRHPWVLILDADERVTPELADELARISDGAPADVGAYRVRRRFHMWGRWLKHSSLYPTWVVRFVHVGRVRYVDRGHAETQEVQGRIADLQHDLIDENLKGLDEWFARQDRYAARDAQYEVDNFGGGLRWGGLLSRDALVRRATLKRIAARMPARAFVYFLYSYFWRGGFLDGRAGLMYCRMRAMYQGQVAVRAWELRQRRGGS